MGCFFDLLGLFGQFHETILNYLVVALFYSVLFLPFLKVLYYNVISDFTCVFSCFL